ncbi:YycC family protein [Bacillus massiliglaciei]|uniref:YycC family protein n=1 Tax=Bacillus massiliglaciei TaxID=1816693 RepID=UPI000DA602DE|nr:YycC family protein [Bacillus massiliglaciei]
MKPLQISPETAQKLAKSLNLPLEQILHMPTSVLLKKMSEAESKQKTASDKD